MTYCSACFFVCEPYVPFCPRCGSAPSSSLPEEEGLRRLGVLRQLVLNRVWDNLAGTRSLRLQVDAIRKMEQATPQPPAAVAQARKWTIPGLVGVLAEPDLSLRYRLLDVLCGWLSNDDAPVLHDHFGRLKRLIAALQSGAKTAAEGRLAAAEAAAWLDRTAAEHGFDAAEICRSLFATPHYWSKLAQAVDARQFEESRSAMLIGYGYAALSNKNFSLAEKNFQEAIQSSLNGPAGYVALGDLLNAQDKHPEAIDAYRKAADLGANSVRALNNIAWHEATTPLGRDRNLDLALAAAERAASLAPVGWVLDTLAEVHHQRGEVAAAIAAARAAALDDPDNPKYWTRLQSLASFMSELFSDLAHIETKPRSGQAFDESDAGPSLPPSDGANTIGDIDIKLADDDALPEREQQVDNFDLELPEEPASRVAHSISLDAEDSGINLSPSDSGLSLDEEPLDLGGNSSIDDVELPQDDEVISLDQEADDADQQTQHRHDEEFHLLPAGELEDEEDSGAQVVALEDMEDDDDEPAAKSSKPAGWNLWPFAKKSGPPDASESSEDLASSFDLDLPSEATEPESEPLPTSRGDFSAAPAAARDKVDCSVFASTEAAPGGMFIVQVAAHLPAQADEARALALESDPAASRRGRTALATEIARGSQLSFELVIPGAAIDESEQLLTWDGRPETVSFFVTAPEQGKNLLAKVLISQDGAPIGQIKFAIALKADSLGVSSSTPTGEALRYRTAFASYASPDRAEVVRRVQMLRVAGIHCFQDVLDLEPGERWERQLWKRIDEADVLFLFWSDHARTSKWVADEWRYALEHRGLDFIRPVILQRRPFVKPPPELNELHFNDKVLAMIDDQAPQAAGRQ